MERQREDTTMQESKRMQVDDPGHPDEIVDEVAVFASPLPMTGERKTTTRVELWASLHCIRLLILVVVVYLLCR
jgi:hypothetical protein